MGRHAAGPCLGEQVGPTQRHGKASLVAAGTRRSRSDDGALSGASTPDSPGILRLAATGCKFQLAEGRKARALAPGAHLSVLDGKLYLMACERDPAPAKGVHFFSMDKVMCYAPFCADFGPFNLGMTHHFIECLRQLFDDPSLRNTKLVYYTRPSVNDVTNAIFLIGAFLVCHMGASAEDAWLPFWNQSCVVRPYRDATWVRSPYDLHVKECWCGLLKAMATGFYHPSTFDAAEYFYYDLPWNGDMHEVVKDKFFAFKGPVAQRRQLGHGRYTLIPSDYCDVFRAKNIRAVVRLNDIQYDRTTFTSHGFDHYDLFFTDCTTPPDHLVDRFLRISEATKGAIAVHCLAGLGRTGTLIAIYMMKHFRFTANECIAWLRIARPGSVIGPQQQYLKDQQARIHALDPRVPGLGDCYSPAGFRKGATSAREADQPEGPTSSKGIAEMVTKGMLMRDMDRCRPHVETSAGLDVRTSSKATIAAALSGAAQSPGQTTPQSHRHTARDSLAAAQANSTTPEGKPSFSDLCLTSESRSAVSLTPLRRTARSHLGPDPSRLPQPQGLASAPAPGSQHFHSRSLPTLSKARRGTFSGAPRVRS